MGNSAGKQPSLATPKGVTKKAIITTLAITAGRRHGAAINDRLLGHREKVEGPGACKCLFRSSEWKDISQNRHASAPGPDTRQREGP